MTRPDDKNPNLRDRVLKYDRPIKPVTNEGEWESFFNDTESVDESFTRGDQGVPQERHFDWDDVFRNIDNYNEKD